MSFRLRSDAEKWFAEIEGELPLKFDIYYFCLMAGLVGVRRAPLTANDKAAFVDDFPLDYRLQQNLLLAGLIEAELSDRLGRSVTSKDKPAVHRAVSELLMAHGSSTHLSPEGAARMNEYASGGFDLLFERMVDKPHRLETFIRAYSKLLADVEAERIASEASFDNA